MTSTAIAKQYLAKLIRLPEGSRRIVATINTAALDRDREVVLPAGGDFTDYLKNPIVLLAHRYNELPIGRALKLKRHPDSIEATTEIAPGPRGDEVLELFKGGFLRGFSIGFETLNSSAPTRDEVRKYPAWAEARLVHRKWRLLEYSIVTVPANPEALATAVAKGKLHLSRDMINLLNDRPRPKLTQAVIVDAINKRLDKITGGRYKFSK